MPGPSCLFATVEASFFIPMLSAVKLTWFAECFHDFFGCLARGASKYTASCMRLEGRATSWAQGL